MAVAGEVDPGDDVVWWFCYRLATPYPDGRHPRHWQFFATEGGRDRSLQGLTGVRDVYVGTLDLKALLEAGLPALPA